MDRYAHFLLSVFLLVALGCGGDDMPIVDDETGLAGRFRLVAASDIDESLVETSLTRDGDPTAVRGEVDLVSTGDGMLDMHIMFAVLEGGLLTEDGADHMVFPVTYDGDTMVLEVDEGRTQVFSYALEGDALTLTRMADDPRDNQPISEGPSSLAMSRVTDDARVTVGRFALTRFVGAEGEAQDTAACYEEDGEFRTFGVTIDIDADRQLVITDSRKRYSDAECTDLLAEENNEAFGFAEESGDVLGLWYMYEDEPESSQYMELTFSETADGMEAARTGCLPAPDCESDGPSAVTLARID